MELDLRGHPIHTRSLLLQLRLSNQAELEARGEILDLRKVGVLPMAGDLQTAGAIHQMRLLLRIERDGRRLREISLQQPAVAFEPSAETAGESCRDPSPRLQSLVGGALDAAFPKRLSQLLGGPRGCSHVLTLFQLMASALPHALDHEEARRKQAAADAGAGPWGRRDGELLFKRSLVVDGLRLGADVIGLAAQLHDFHTTPYVQNPGPMERLELQREVRVAARVGVAKIEFLELRGAERQRSGREMAAGCWEDRNAELEPLVGRGVTGGLARELFARFGDRADRRLLLDTLLNLGPTVVQCTPSMVDFLIGAGPAGAPASRDARDLSGAIMMGGYPDSCFMWRSDGPMAGQRRGLETRLAERAGGRAKPGG